MRKAKAQKRLVGMRPYLKTQGEKTLHYLKGVFCVVGGLFPLVIGARFLLTGAPILSDPSYRRIDFIISGSMILGILGIFIWAAVWAAKSCFVAAHDIEPVRLITKFNAEEVPEVDSLVRSSDRIATEPQAELLRAVRQEAETPPEQLLRAARADDSR